MACLILPQWTVQYENKSWHDYVAKSFLYTRRLNPDQQKDGNIYKVTDLNGDFIDITSIGKEECDNIESSTPVSVQIRWRENNLLLIYFYECNLNEKLWKSVVGHYMEQVLLFDIF